MNHDAKNLPAITDERHLLLHSTREAEPGCIGVGHGFGFEVVRETLGTFRYNSIGSFVTGGAYRTYNWVDPAKDLVGIILMQRTNCGGDVADEINSFMAMTAAAIDR